jgi:hypothetical protein
MTWSLALAIVALIVSVTTFWLTNVRRGSLRVSPPHVYALTATNPVLLLRLPLAIYNTGARAIVVRDLRCWFPEEKTEQVLPLPWRATRRSLQPTKDDLQDWPVPFQVRGHEAETSIVEFGCPLPGFTLQQDTYRLKVEVLEDGSDRWRGLVEFDLYVTADSQQLESHLTYSNLGPDDQELGRLTRSLTRIMLDLSAEQDPSAS